MTELDATTYDVIWRLPALPDQRRPAAVPVWPDEASDSPLRPARLAGDRWEQRYTLITAAPLVGQTVRFNALRGAATEVIVRVQRSDGTLQLERVQPSEPHFIITKSPGGGEVVRAYFVLGVEHILGGIDHLLFVLALLLIVLDLRRLILTITAFTVAHSLTLIAATLGLLPVPGPPVEAIIALSIVFVAAEALHSEGTKASLTGRAPWVVAFAFGLLHGLGFAGALGEVGLPASDIPLALLMFNVGVEAGQCVFVLVVAGFGSALGRWRGVSLRAVSRTASYVIGTLAAFWTFERVAGFF